MLLSFTFFEIELLYMVNELEGKQSIQINSLMLALPSISLIN